MSKNTAKKDTIYNVVDDARAEEIAIQELKKSNEKDLNKKAVDSFILAMSLCFKVILAFNLNWW